MKILYYRTERSSISERLQKSIEDATQDCQISIAISVNNLLDEIPDLAYGKGIAVLLTTSRKELEHLLTIREQLRDIRIILILPDQKAQTIARGHRLYPRYVSYADCDFNDVSAVLSNMVALKVPGIVKKIIHTQKIFNFEIGKINKN